MSSEFIKYYVAGIVDGEGCLDISRQKRRNVKGQSVNYYYPKITISNNNLEVLMKIKEYLGYGRLYSDKKKCFMLVLNGDETLTLLDEIGELLIVKREEVRLMYNFYKDRENAELYYIQLKNMRRGYVA